MCNIKELFTPMQQVYLHPHRRAGPVLDFTKSWVGEVAKLYLKLTYE